MKIFNGVLIFLLVISTILGISWIETGNDFFLYKFFAPKQEAVRYQVFKQSQSYNEGVINEIYQYKREYEKTTDSNNKASIRSALLGQYGSYNRAYLPPDLDSFMNKLDNPLPMEMKE